MNFNENDVGKHSPFAAVSEFLNLHKIAASVVALLLVLGIVSSVLITKAVKKPSKADNASSALTVVSEPEESTAVSETDFEESETVSVQETAAPSKSASSVNATSKAPVSTQPKPVPKPVTKPVADYKYNTNTDIDNNLFLDALIYTGYNIKKHRADGMMWQYILSTKKRGMGYLSRITYGGGSSGYETANGKPDIKYFEKHGLVCASYVTYVYFNYLPNVAGINTTYLPKPTRSTSANDWYVALKQWLNKGYSRKISFTASKTSAGFINFKPNEEIPIGSIIVFCDAKRKSDFGSHVAIYAGYKNNYHWITHVGNSNGPEFCAVERMHFGHDPQWPIAVITPPTNMRFSPALEINAVDNNGSPIVGIKLTLKNKQSGAVINLGTTDLKGKFSKEGLSYGNYELGFTVPEGYTSAVTAKEVKLTTANNSKTDVSIVFEKKLPPPPPVSSDVQAPTSSVSNPSSSAQSNSSDNTQSNTSENTPSNTAASSSTETTAE